jgi:hypothetical protein
MKNSLLFTLLMLVAGYGISQANTEITVVNVPQPVNDTLLFALPIDVNHYQHIQNYPDAQPSSRMMKFQPEYVVTSTDFSHGDLTKGTATLPAYAKVIGLALDGYDMGSDPTSHGMFLEVTAWCKNVEDGTELNGDYDEFLGNGYRAPWNKPQGQLLTDTITHRGYRGHPGFISTFDPNASAEHPATIVNCPFNMPDENGKFIPFIYNGESIYLTMWICNWEDIHLKYRYMAYDDAELECASLMRSGAYCFSSASVPEIPADQLEYWYDLPEHRLPAFRTPYYTSDVRITMPELKAKVELREANDSKGTPITPAEDGNYYSLDHTKTYIITVDGEFTKEVVFDDMYSDIDLMIMKDLTAVEEVNADKTVASVAYYNLAGQQSQQPMDGMNIVVTTYTDGSTTTAKVIK